MLRIFVAYTDEKIEKRTSAKKKPYEVLTIEKILPFLTYTCMISIFK